MRRLPAILLLLLLPAAAGAWDFRTGSGTNELVLAPAEELEQLREQLRGATKVMSHFIGLYDQAARVLTTRS